MPWSRSRRREHFPPSRPGQRGYRGSGGGQELGGGSELAEREGGRGMTGQEWGEWGSEGGGGRGRARGTGTVSELPRTAGTESQIH